MILFWAVSRTLKQYLSLAVIFVLDENSDIKRLLKRYDYKVLELPGCKNLAGTVGYEQGMPVYRLLSGWKIRNGGTGRPPGTKNLCICPAVLTMMRSESS